MTYKADDLTPLLAPSKASELGFHQGTILTWDQGTAENTVSMAGTTLTDVPVLNGTEVPLLAAGDVVGMMRHKSTYFIMGRIVIPNQPNVGVLPDANQSGGALDVDFDISTTREVICSKTFTVPQWANQAIVMCVANASINNPTASSQFVYCAATVNGGFGGEMYSQIATGAYEHISSATQFPFGVGSDYSLGSTITVACLMRASADLASVPTNQATVHATLSFRKA